MGYFSHGAEGSEYAARFCRGCVHGNAGWPTCAVWTLHERLNYQQGGTTPAGKIVATTLSALIPRSADGLDNDECAMFLPRETKVN